MFGKTLENLTRDAREITKNYALGYKSTQVAFARFLEDSTNQENRYVINITEDSQQNEDDNDAEKESGVESVGGRSLKLWEKTDSGYGNTDQRCLMYSLNNVDRQLKEVTENTNKNIENSNFLYLKY